MKQDYVSKFSAGGHLFRNCLNRSGPKYSGNIFKGPLTSSIDCSTCDRLRKKPCLNTLLKVNERFPIDIVGKELYWFNS